jgi:hypothetical protein
MIYLKESNIIFMKPTKVAGTSFEIALSRYAKQEDILTPISGVDESLRRKLGFRTCQNYRRDLLEWKISDFIRLLKKMKGPKRFFNHISAEKVRELIGKDSFDSAFKISIVRNPYDRIISRYFWSTRNKDKISIEQWIKNNPALVNDNYNQYFIDGDCIIDYFIRYENLEKDCLKLEQIKNELTGLWDIFKSTNAKGNIRPTDATTSAILSDKPDVVDVIKSSNADIIARFDYKFE